MDYKQRCRLAIKAQGRALRQLCRENRDEYLSIYHRLLRSGYRQNNALGGPKAQARARTELSHLYPDRYRELYLKYKEELFCARR